MWVALLVLDGSCVLLGSCCFRKALGLEFGGGQGMREGIGHYPRTGSLAFGKACIYTLDTVALIQKPYITKR